MQKSRIHAVSSLISLILCSGWGDGARPFLYLKVAPDLELIPGVLFLLHHDALMVEVEVDRQAQLGVAGHPQQLDRKSVV